MAKVTVDGELFDTLIEYAIALRFEWRWRSNSSQAMQIEYAELVECIEEAVKVRDNITCGNKEVQGINYAQVDARAAGKT